MRRFDRGLRVLFTVRGGGLSATWDFGCLRGANPDRPGRLRPDPADTSSAPAVRSRSDATPSGTARRRLGESVPPQFRVLYWSAIRPILDSIRNLR